MIRGLGLDLCGIARMEKLLEDSRFLERYFTPAEIAYIRERGKGGAQSMAGIFAAKEALGKALGSGLDFSLTDAEIRHDEYGRPYYAFTGELARRTENAVFLLSISHDNGTAGAVCVWTEE